MKEQIGPYKKIQKLNSKEEGLETVPKLNLSGKWLKTSGFKEGEKVEITYGYEYIVIYPYKNETL